MQTHRALHVFGMYDESFLAAHQDVARFVNAMQQSRAQWKAALDHEKDEGVPEDSERVLQALETIRAERQVEDAARYRSNLEGLTFEV